VHPFETGRPLILGGVLFEGETGLAGHSDGDVLTHAVIDALLGAAALGDIGSHLPTGDERWRGADSMELLRAVVAKVAASGLKIVNLDATLIGEHPRIAPKTTEIRQRLSGAIGIDLSCIS